MNDLPQRIAAVVVAVLFAIGTALWALIAGGEFRSGRRVIAQASALVCLPCNGHPGETCTCEAKRDCPNPACGAADTTIMHAISRR